MREGEVEPPTGGLTVRISELRAKATGSCIVGSRLAIVSARNNSMLFKSMWSSRVYVPPAGGAARREGRVPLRHFRSH